MDFPHTLQFVVERSGTSPSFSRSQPKEEPVTDTPDPEPPATYDDPPDIDWAYLLFLLSVSMLTTMLADIVANYINAVLDRLMGVEQPANSTVSVPTSIADRVAARITTNDRRTTTSIRTTTRTIANNRITSRTARGATNGRVVNGRIVNGRTVRGTVLWRAYRGFTSGLVIHSRGERAPDGRLGRVPGARRRGRLDGELERLLACAQEDPELMELPRDEE